MNNLHILPRNNTDLLSKLQTKLGGNITETFGKITLTVNNSNGFGTIKYLQLDWGVELIQLDIRFSEYYNLTLDASEFNPIQFIYSSNGRLGHYYEDPKDLQYVEEFHTLILTSKDGSKNNFVFPKDQNLQITIIQIVRQEFLKKKHSNVSQLNKQLYEVFMDTDHENKFRFFGSFNLKIADKINELQNLKSKGMIRILKIEAIVYEILSLHIQTHKNTLDDIKIPDSLLKSELRIIRKLSKKIVDNPSKNYDLKSMSMESGLSQLKLQDGFKHLYNRTVTDYIRHIRLQTARDLIRNSELNISQVVYTIGFTSRSYFSKIFKEKYGITPHEFKKQALSVSV
ncbi:AraC family transcriptional regulator [Hanstruepera ponticola]|uniref:AraC family transcriptional regulator n=1 Tax=Hanstruepera ponticola TaxID=2042995 RepID=UPI000CF0272B|nr:helix-turn-helix domain-containing protein [Hanstruepera ponticola]